MKNRIFFIALIMMVLPIGAQTYKCKNEKGEYLFSDTPCISKHEIEKNIKIDYDGVVVHLSTRYEPLPLPNRIVDNFFDTIESACKTKDTNQLLKQFSKSMQEQVKRRVGSNLSFDDVSFACKKIENIKNDIVKSKQQVFYASKMPNKYIELCFYDAKKGLDNCIGIIKVIAEDGQLKLNSY